MVCTNKMHENTWERVTFLINLMFSRLDNFDGPIFEGRAWRRSLSYRNQSIDHWFLHEITSFSMIETSDMKKLGNIYDRTVFDNNYLLLAVNYSHVVPFKTFDKALNEHLRSAPNYAGWMINFVKMVIIFPCFFYIKWFFFLY